MGKKSNYNNILIVTKNTSIQQFELFTKPKDQLLTLSYLTLHKNVLKLF